MRCKCSSDDSFRMNVEVESNQLIVRFTIRKINVKLNLLPFFSPLMFSMSLVRNEKPLDVRRIYNMFPFELVMFGKEIWGEQMTYELVVSIRYHILVYVMKVDFVIR